jgi:integrase
VKSLGITDEAEARAVGVLLAKIRRHERYWPLFDAIIKEHPHYGARDLLAASYERGGVKRLLRQLEDVDLDPLIDTWFKALKKSVAEDTRQHYRSAVRQVIPPMRRFASSRLTSSFLQDQIDSWDVEPATARKRGIGIRRFTKWLKRKKLIRRDPMRDVELPQAGDPRDVYVELWEHLKIADAQESPYREFSAMLASGIEVSVLLTITRRDVKVADREVFAPGTKTWNRKRYVRIPDEVWPYVLKAIEGLHPDTKLFAGIPDRWYANDAHRLAIYGEQIDDRQFTKGELPKVSSPGLIETMPRLKGYQMRDARHTYAVRAVRAGVAVGTVAKQLGHKTSELVQRVYGRHEPSQQERDRAERLASAADVIRKKESEL